MRLAVALVLGMALPLHAEPSDIMVDLMEDGLVQYAGVAGKVHACFITERGKIPEYAERIAEWRYASWWSGLTGTRSDYAERIRSRAQLRFDSEYLSGCDRITGGLFRGVMHKWESQLASDLRQ